MSSPAVIDVQDVSVSYKMYPRPMDILREAVFGGVHHDTFRALSEVSFSVKEGERIGIIGPNGAGKSTLLRVIAGNLTPTNGSVDVNGRISSLLSMVPAWNGESNAIENIKFNLMVQQIPEKEIEHLVEDIVDFTELGPFVYQPLKTYSTGMSARLAFGIATATEPDILIVDEVLGTGDGYFASKAIRRMEEFCARGRALLFVSHSVAAVQQMCSRVLWMQNGGIRADGKCEDVLARYELDYRRSEDEVMRGKNLAQLAKAPTKPLASELGDEVLRLRLVSEDQGRFRDNHYVRRISIVNLHSAEEFSVPLEIAKEVPKETARLDTLNSEWGRLHDKHGVRCRVLQRSSGRNSGGQVLLGQKTAQADQDGIVSIEVSIENKSELGNEQLTVQTIDLEKAEWISFDLKEQKELEDGWILRTFTGKVKLQAEEVEEQVRERLVEMSLETAVVEDVSLVVDGKVASVVKEYEPFKIRIDTQFNRSVPLADVGLKISKADGTYVFWQSSGMADANLVNPNGRKTVEFNFEDNVFGAGEYFVNCFITNGWDFPDNYPNSEVFDRRLNALSFRIMPKEPTLDLGVVAKIFSVDVK